MGRLFELIFLLAISSGIMQSLGDYADTSSISDLAVIAQNVPIAFLTKNNDARYYVEKIQTSIASLTNTLINWNTTVPWIMDTTFPAIVSNITNMSSNIFDSLSSAFLGVSSIIEYYDSLANNFTEISDDLFYSVRKSTNSNINSLECQRRLTVMRSAVNFGYSSILRNCAASYLRDYTAFKNRIDRNLTNIQLNSALVVGRLVSCRLVNFRNRENFINCANNVISLYDYIGAYEKFSESATTFNSTIQPTHHTCVDSIAVDIVSPLGNLVNDLKKSCVNSS